MRFTGRFVVLTGVGREGQVGEAVARAFAEEGAALALLERDAATAERRAAALRAAGARADAFPCDLTDPAQVAAVAARVAEAAGGRVHALVNLAGGFGTTGRLDEGEVDAWHRMVAINLTTAYVATRAFLPLLRAADGSPGGAVVYFASVAALPEGSPAGMAAYAAAKSGVLALMRAVAADERRAGVRANAVAPSAVRTAANVQAMGEQARYVEREEVADVVLYLCSDAARAVTGQTIRL